MLVVATHSTVLNAATQVLSREKWVKEVREAQLGAEALEQVQTWRPDLVLIDLRLPDLRGIDLARQLKMLPSASRVVLMTVGGVGIYRDLLSVLGADGVIDKRHMVQKIKTFLAALPATDKAE